MLSSIAQQTLGWFLLYKARLSREPGIQRMSTTPTQDTLFVVLFAVGLGQTDKLLGSDGKPDLCVIPKDTTTKCPF